ncbi:3-oxoacyl-[acyl-carrier-protein] reductase [Alkalihalobacillus sp. MEB130]|uniref:3-oxoacyl-[acyl-carrier-protein] reductase n=1 Tax=Alkalihalobacillus sp. MEB130 TaxID=2976704 RepID=UPI0028DD774E|nr:3-oxoacyl-[acyl-carrier-protein] reductase [Alkalihalobacillus sp. MEB130]MDT8860148.1 3-oxoacyl-[acyl-carrier-protein] reductase [Alkalihalobacillus sp. MEB130]
MTIILNDSALQQSENKSLAGKVAIVTGGSRGIGSTIAKELAKKGAQVVINYNSAKEAADEVLFEIEQLGGSAVSFQANVANFDEAQSLVENTQNYYGKVDILVNNAGITRDRTFRKLSEKDWNEVINVNLNSIYHTTSAVINPMLEQKFGRIINMSSIIGQAGGFGQTNYSASKAGMIGFTKSLALETARSGITVNAICPGYIETEMVKEIPEKVKEQLISKIPMQRLGQTSEIADAVLFLANNSYITGQCINVNGGLYM